MSNESFKEQLRIYFEERENKLPQVSYKPMLKYFWDAAQFHQQNRIDKLEKEKDRLYWKTATQADELDKNRKTLKELNRQKETLARDKGDMRIEIQSLKRKLEVAMGALDELGWHAVSKQALEKIRGME